MYMSCQWTFWWIYWWSFWWMLKKASRSAADMISREPRDRAQPGGHSVSFQGRIHSSSSDAPIIWSNLDNCVPIVPILTGEINSPPTTEVPHMLSTLPWRARVCMQGCPCKAVLYDQIWFCHRPQVTDSTVTLKSGWWCQSFVLFNLKTWGDNPSWQEYVSCGWLKHSPDHDIVRYIWWNP